MRKTCGKVAMAIGLAAGLFAAQPAQAVVIQGVAAGEVVSGKDFGPNYTWGFNSTTDLAGQAFTVNFTYNTALAPADTDPAASIGFYQDKDDFVFGDQAGWFVISLTINGVTHQFVDNAGSSVKLFDQAWLGNDHYVIFGQAMVSDFLSLAITSNGLDFLTGVGLSQTFTLNAGNGIGIDGDFQVDGLNQYSYGKLAYHSVSLTALDSQSVPEPASLALFAAAIAGLGWSRRRTAVVR